LIAALAVVAVSASTAWAQAAEPNWPDALVIGTASPGGTYHAYGEGLAKILSRDLGIRVTVRPTEGPNENIALLESGEIQLGFVTTGIALQAWNGSGEWVQGKQLRSMRVMFPMYVTPFHFMAMEESGIRSIADMAGKRVGAGPRTGTAGIYMPEFFKTLGVEADFHYGEWAELAKQMQDRQLDVLAVAAGVPFPAFAELEAKNKVRYVPLTPEQITALDLAKPELDPSEIPAGSYPSLMAAYKTVGLYNLAVAHESLPSDLVYSIIKSVFANHDEMIAAHPAAAETIPANFTRNTFLPFHGGAIRYYQDLGVSGVAISD